MKKTLFILLMISAHAFALDECPKFNAGMINEVRDYGNSNSTWKQETSSHVLWNTFELLNATNTQYQKYNGDFARANESIIEALFVLKNWGWIAMDCMGCLKGINESIRAGRLQDSEFFKSAYETIRNMNPIDQSKCQ